MKKNIIISTSDTLSGSPRLNGRRLDVRHVIWGLSEYDSWEAFLRDFEITPEQAKHAILYCKDQVCEQENVPQACTGCSKKFSKDVLINDEIEPRDSWKDAEALHLELKEHFNLPKSYDTL